MMARMGGQTPPGSIPQGEAPAAPERRQISLRGLHLTGSERRWLLAVVDVLILNTVLLGMLSWRYGYPFSLTAVWEAPLYYVLLTLLWFAAASFFDCYDLPRTADGSQSSWSAARAALMVGVVYIAIPFVTPPFPVSRGTTYLFLVLLVASVATWRAMYAAVFVQPTFQRRVLIVGAGRAGTELAQALASTPQVGNLYAGSGYHVVGFVDDDPAKAGLAIAGAPVLGTRHDLLRLVAEQQVDAVVVAITHAPQIHADLFRSLLDSREQGLQLETMSSLYERVTGRVAVGHAGRDLRVILPSPEAAGHRVFLVSKRLLDLLAGVVGGAFLCLLVPVVAVANRIWSPGPLFYWQERVGKAGRTFRLVKFRSMVPAAEESCGAVWARSADARVTPVGRWLRRTRLDELPQVWNILRGEMSLVGPRPERPEFVAQLVEQVPFYQVRHAVRPGITGWAQVRYRYGDSVEDALVKLQYDLYYIKHQGLYLELSILFKTAAAVLRLEGR